MSSPSLLNEINKARVRCALAKTIYADGIVDLHKSQVKSIQHAQDAMATAWKTLEKAFQDSTLEHKQRLIKAEAHLGSLLVPFAHTEPMELEEIIEESPTLDIGIIIVSFILLMSFTACVVLYIVSQT